MKLLIVSNKGIKYEFRYLEQSKVVEVSKADKFMYLIRKSIGLFRCDCPGAIYHHKCWHTSMIALLMRQQTIEEPWTEWAEEAGRMMYESRY